MTTPRMALVPVPSTDQMVESAITAETYSEAIEHAIAASPAGGKVTIAQRVKAAHALKNLIGGIGTRADAVLAVIKALGLEVEE